MRHEILVSMSFVFWLGLAACSQTATLDTAEPQIVAVAPQMAVSASAPTVHRTLTASDIQLQRGAGLYAQYCAGCHGKTAEGSAAGPSLDGTGHTWHHPMHVLQHKTKNGFRQMPAFADRMTDSEIDDVILWFQSLWPETVYSNWQRRWYGSATSTQ